MHYAITDLTAAPGTPESRQAQLKTSLLRWMGEGVDFVQLREKTLPAEELLALAELAADTLRTSGQARPFLLVNGRVDIAGAARADGVHLTAGAQELSPAQAREVFAAACLPRCFVSISCHDVQEVRKAKEANADLLLFGPVFEKRVGGKVVARGLGLEALRQACSLAGGMPLLALGGVTMADERACLEAGAAGIAGIRLFAG